jgi:hypothetical protein
LSSTTVASTSRDPGRALVAYDIGERHALDGTNQRSVQFDHVARLVGMTQVHVADDRVAGAGDTAVGCEQNIGPRESVRPRETADHMGCRQQKRGAVHSPAHRYPIGAWRHRTPVGVEASAIQRIAGAERYVARDYAVG